MKLRIRVLSAVCAAGLTAAQVPPIVLTPVAIGSNPDPDLKIKAKGPTTIEQDKITIQPGVDGGWHTHPGPALVVVTRGAVTLYKSEECRTVYSTGSFFMEPENQVHKLVNETGDVSEIYGTLILPAGSPLLVPATSPGREPCHSEK
jgi:hypothetical protein